LTHWYGRGLDPSLPATVLAKPVATMVDVLHWENIRENRAAWAGEFLYWLDPDGVFLTSVRFMPSDRVSPESIQKIRLREEWVLHGFAHMNCVNVELVAGREPARGPERSA
jgi:hypothetical protein